MPRRFGYSRWDGTQAGFELDAEGVLARVTDDVLYHGDVNAALRRLLQSGLRDANGERIAGLRELLERLRRQRSQDLQRHQLGAFADIAGQLRDVVDLERDALEELVDAAGRSGDERRLETAQQLAAERRVQLDLLPPDLSGMIRALQEYEFSSTAARERFEELLDRLRRELMESQFNRMTAAMGNLTPEGVQRMKDMFNELNRLVEMREAGEDTTGAFSEFMQRHGDFFPGTPGTLDELLEQMAGQMAAMQAVMNSMTPEQRAQLQELSDQLLSDLDLRWQVERLGHNLRRAFPGAGWERGYELSGQDPLGLAQAARLMGRLGDLDQLENLLRSATSPGALADVDLDRARLLLGADAADSLDRLARLTTQLQEAGLVEQREGRLELTPRGVRRIGRNALADLFSRLSPDRPGGHQVDHTGAGHERAHETKPYEFGDPFVLSIERTVRNAVHRGGGGSPVRLAPEDFEVERTEALTRTATVLLIDLSLSMPMRDNFLAAKRVAMALHSLISTQFPRDFLAVVGFSEVARRLDPRRLPEVSWDFTSGTNMHHAFMLSRRLLAGETGTKQILMITDGEPTAHIDAAGEPFFSYPPVRETLDATLTEVLRCTRAGIRINTFMLDATEYLRAFVERLTGINRGRAFFTTPETLGDYLLVDFMEHKRVHRGGGRRPRPA